VPRLKFIRNKQAWGTSLRRTLVRIDQEDYTTIQRAFNEQLKKDPIASNR
jgi:hypothetical protein